MFDIDINFSKKVRTLRAEKNMTLAKASNEIGISSKSLSLIENEKKSKINKRTYQKVMNWLISN
ncbi:helix-turn-helix domain-containing protein [Staphylococcus hominis]|uniref:helix-turn-helix domain-containing protein n=1 Tax=Staphylococcus TaxID=1279 RepID=UPI0011A7C965|nr:helix-turn-helix domain-containing protein [Staphylococcus hominis]MDS3837108.1 helix-turn-helix domain-containing protein [Staphylococcus hominis]MDS3871815.1 helix-turn-helix domain-containing protein [Staphylococcus hominis]MEB5575357.1 helix-turn-helix domain-containing protein [Staphylococcus hominis]